jgi:hypothetical protein
MPNQPDLSAIRELAMTLAVDLHREHFEPSDDITANRKVTRTASAIFAWLTGPIALFIAMGPVLDQNTGEQTGNNPKGSPMQLHDNEQVDLTVSVLDAKGASILDDPATTSDDLSWVVTDQSVATLTISADTRTCTVAAGMPGSTTGTVTLGDLSATFAVDVIPGAAAKVTISEGTPTEQPPATPPADGGTGDTPPADGGTGTTPTP